MANTQKSKWQIVKIVLIACVAIGITIGVTTFISTLTIQGAKVPDYLVENAMLKISGMYGTEISLVGAEIAYITDSPLAVTKRTGGYYANGIRKGSFTANGYDGEIYINMFDNSKPYIRIYSNQKYYFINTKLDTETKSLYDTVLKVA